MQFSAPCLIVSGKKINLEFLFYINSESNKTCPFPLYEKPYAYRTIQHKAIKPQEKLQISSQKILKQGESKFVFPTDNFGFQGKY